MKEIKKRVMEKVNTLPTIDGILKIRPKGRVIERIIESTIHETLYEIQGKVNDIFPVNSKFTGYKTKVERFNKELWKLKKK